MFIKLFITVILGIQFFKLILTTNITPSTIVLKFYTPPQNLHCLAGTKFILYSLL